MKKDKPKHYKNKPKSKIINLFHIISLIIMIICAIYIFLWFKESKHNEEIAKVAEEAVTEKYNEEEKKVETIIDFESLKKINSDVIGWIKVNNTKINYSVVKCKDNSFYLNHSLDKAYNGHGWPFVDYRNRMDGTDKNITIYGHNIKDGSMFGTLENILSEEWYKNKDNLNISFITESGTQNYEVFSVYEIKKETYYTTNNFKNDTEFESFINNIKSRSIYDFNVDISKDDQILTLSTCADNNTYRTVLHARKISEK